MQQLKLFFNAVPFGLVLLACSGTTADKTKSAGNSGPAPASGSGKDMYYEYVSTTGSKDMTIKTNTRMYISSGGDMRVEMDMENSRGKGPVKIVTIGHSDKPNESISIEDGDKTYSINHFRDSDFNTGQKVQSTATKIGEEKILGFNSVHAKIISNKSIGSLYSNTDTLDLWRSNEVPLLASVKELMEKFDTKTGMLYSPDVAAQLKQMGCEGFMTKLELHSKHTSVTETLVKVEHRDLPSNIFQIPAGYKETKNGIGE